MIYLVGFAVMATVVMLMSVGVLMGRKPISGSCGGVGAALREKDYVCDICGGDEAKCEESKLGPNSEAPAELFHDASKKP